MAALDGRNSALALAHEALRCMAGHGLSPSPPTYAVWYHYVIGDNSPLQREVDARTAMNGGITEQDCMDIFMEFYGAGDEGEKIGRIGEQLRFTASGLMRQTETASSEATAFDSSLRDFTTQIEDVGEIAGISESISKVLRQTSAMREANATLERSLSRASSEIDRLRDQLGEVRREAQTDPLTGISNRRGFDRSFAAAAAFAARSGQPLSLLLLDIDFFKKFNDNHGHQLGDEVLRVVARAIEDIVKDQGVAARYGGEEFAVILPEMHGAAAMEVAERIRKKVASRMVVRKSSGEQFGTVTLSIGVAMRIGGEPIPELIERADRNLYKAKQTGRNRVVGWTPEPAAPSE